MKLLYYELRKLAGMKYLWALLLIMLAVCCGVFVYGTRYRYSQDRIDIYNALNDFYREYEKSPDRINTIMKNVAAYIAERDSPVYDDDDIDWDTFDYEEYLEELAERYGIYRLGYTYRDGTPISDEYFYDYLNMALSSEDNYRDYIDRVLNVTDGVMKRLELQGKTDSPIYEYECHFHDLYAPLRDSVEFQVSTLRGWDAFFAFDEISIFIYVYLMLAASVVFLHERTNGFLSVLRTTDGGRIKTSFAKVGAVIIASVFVVVVFTVCVYTTCYVTIGFSSGTAPIQSFIVKKIDGLIGLSSDYKLFECPYALTMWGYAAVSLLMRCVCATAFACVLTLISAVTFSPVITYATGAAVIVINVVVNYFMSSSNWLRLNLVSLASTNDVLGTHDEVLFAGHYIGVLGLGMFICALAVVASSVATVIIGGRRGVVTLPSSWQRIRSVKIYVREIWHSLSDKMKKSAHLRRYPSSIFMWECRKLLTPGMLILVLALFGASIYNTFDVYGKDIQEAKLAYEEYISSNYFGEYGADKAQSISDAVAENAEIGNSDKHDEMMSQYYMGLIGEEELEAYMNVYYEAVAVSSQLQRVSEQSSYLRQLEDETGVRGWFVSDAHLSRLFGRGIDIFLLAAVVVIFSRAYSADYAGGSSAGDFSVLLRTTERGRRASFRAKMLSTLTVSLVIALMFTAVDVIVAVSSTPQFFDMLSAPMMSFESHRALDSGITVGAYIALMLLFRLVVCVTIAFLTVFASSITKKISLTLFVIAAFTLLPYVLVYMGMSPLSYVDITAALAGDKLLTRSTEFAVAGGAYTFAAMIVIAYAALTVIGAIYVRKKTGE